MDIRNFFGAPKKAKTEADPPAPALTSSETGNGAAGTPNAVANSPAKKAKVMCDEAPAADGRKPKRSIIEDDDDTEANAENKAHEPVKQTPANAIEKVKSPQKQSNTPVKTQASLGFNAAAKSDKVGGIPKELAEFVTWAPEAHIPYSAVVETFEAVSRVSGRIDKENLFTKLFRAAIHTTPSGMECAKLNLAA
jgi:hypothetical protein